MTQKIKDYVGIALVVALIIISLSAWSYVRSYAKISEPSSFRSFSVTGEGKSVGIPDIAEFSFGVVTEGGKDIAPLQKENTDKSNKILEFVKAQGVDSKDIKTTQYNVGPRYKYFSCPQAGGVCPPAEIVGYTIRQNVLVKIRDFQKIGTLLGGVVTNGANTVSGISFTIDDPTKVENEARMEAIAKAKVKAEGVARAGGFRLGRLLSIEESGYPIPYYRDSFAMGKGGAEIAPAVAPTIEPGSSETTITVILRYEIE